LTARRLVSIRRRVAEGMLEAYRARWSSVREAVEGAGQHAWSFVSASDPREMIEFLEFADGADPRDDPRAAAALGRLEREYGGTLEEWEEAG
jgi:hypothetical protein